MKRPKNPAPASDGSNGATAPSDAPANGAPEARAPDPPSSAPAPELTEATPDEKLAALAAERDETKDRMLRIAADFENWKKRAQKEQTDKANEARERVLKDMLEVIDNLERAVEHAQGGGNGKPLVDGVRMVLQGALDVLARHGITRIEAAGEAFDPNRHEAVASEHVPDTEPNRVVRQFLPGYALHDRVVRPAKVSVSAKAPVDSPPDDD